MVLLVLIYVDDILITGDCSDFINQFVHRLNSVFALKDIGSLTYYLGVGIFRTEQGMHLL